MEVISAVLRSFDKPLIDFEFCRDFVYCHSLVGTEYARTDQVERHVASSALSPTSILHLPQHHFETLLRQDYVKFTSQLQGRHDNCTEQPSEMQFFSGFDAELVSKTSQDCTLRLRPTNNGNDQYLQCEYLVAADGAHSRIRQTLGIEMEGKDNMQHLMNVHFHCPGLRHYLLQQRRPAMLYFVFHQAMVAVFVSHNPLKDEWVCQIPYFPPFQQPSVSSATSVEPSMVFPERFT